MMQCPKVDECQSTKCGHYMPHEINKGCVNGYQEICPECEYIEFINKEEMTI